MKDAPQKPRKKFLRTIAPLTVITLSVIGMISCVTINRVVVVPPEIPGAHFVGSKNCEECHGNITKGFHGATHSRLMAKGENAANMGCETCHGPGSTHSEGGGGRGNIINPKRSPEVCFQCHLEMRGKFNLPHHHPVAEGKVSCVDCHNPHKGDAIKAGPFALTSQIDTCGACHIAQRGPFVFEHEAVREGCTTCHDPH